MLAKSPFNRLPQQFVLQEIYLPDHLWLIESQKRLVYIFFLKFCGKFKFNSIRKYFIIQRRKIDAVDDNGYRQEGYLVVVSFAMVQKKALTEDTFNVLVKRMLAVICNFIYCMKHPLQNNHQKIILFLRVISRF